MSNILKSFLEQQKFSDKEADIYQETIQNIKNSNYEKAIKELYREEPSIADVINAPTKITPNSLNDKAQPHPNFKNYDHSLEKIRGKFNGQDDLIEMGNLTSKDVLPSSNTDY